MPAIQFLIPNGKGHAFFRVPLSYFKSHITSIPCMVFFLLFNPYFFIIDTPLQCFCMRFYKDVYFILLYSPSCIFRYIFDAIYLYFRTVWNFVRICCYCSVYLCIRTRCSYTVAFSAALCASAIIRYFKGA